MEVNKFWVSVWKHILSRTRFCSWIFRKIFGGKRRIFYFLLLFIYVFKQLSTIWQSSKSSMTFSALDLSVLSSPSSFVLVILKLPQDSQHITDRDDSSIYCYDYTVLLWLYSFFSHNRKIIRVSKFSPGCVWLFSNTTLRVTTKAENGDGLRQIYWR